MYFFRNVSLQVGLCLLCVSVSPLVSFIHVRGEESLLGSLPGMCWLAGCKPVRSVAKITPLWFLLMGTWGWLVPSEAGP